MLTQTTPGTAPDTAEQPAFQAFQHDFARFLRDPANAARPAHVSNRGADIYARLLYGNLRSFLDRCFPLSSAILGDTQWQTLCRRFYRDHPLRSPIFRDMLGDFVEFLSSAGAPSGLPAWLPELAHFEWLEMVIAVASTPPAAVDADGDLLQACPVTNPSLLLLSYNWPVHRISTDWQPDAPEPSYLLMLRDDRHTVRMHHSNPTTLRLLSFLDGKTRGQDALHTLAAEIGYQPVSELIGFGAALLTELRQLGVVCGTNPDHDDKT